MGSMARLEPLPLDEWDDETRSLLGDAPLNIFSTLAHHPKLLKRWLVFGNHVLAKTTLPARERELVILRTGWRCGCAYEFGQHTVIGRRDGITDDEIRALCRDSLDGWSPTDATLLAAVDQLVDHQRVDDDTWGALSADWSTQQVMDLVFAVGQYTLVSMALNTFAVELDDGVPGFPT
jgi:4-carboxymuconolactone decarboxylase